MNTNHVPFHVDDGSNSIDPLSIIRQLQRTNRVFINEYEPLRHKFSPGKTSLRLIPSHKESLFGWFLPFETYSFDNCPELIRPGSIQEQQNDDPVIEFKRYLVRYTNLLRQPRESDKNKVELKIKQRAIAWALITKSPQTIKPLASPLALLFGSNNKIGILGYMAKLYANSSLNPNASGNENHNIAHPRYGKIVQIEVTEKASSSFSDYKTTRGNNPNNLYDLWPNLISKHPQVSKEFIPLEKTLHIPTQENLLNMLTDYIANLGPTGQEAFRDFISAGSFRHHLQQKNHNAQNVSKPVSRKAELSGISIQPEKNNLSNQPTDEFLQAESLCIEFAQAYRSNASKQLTNYKIDKVEHALDLAVTHFYYLTEEGAEAVDHLSQLNIKEILNDPSHISH